MGRTCMLLQPPRSLNPFVTPTSIMVSYVCTSFAYLKIFFLKLNLALVSQCVRHWIISYLALTTIKCGLLLDGAESELNKVPSPSTAFLDSNKSLQVNNSLQDSLNVGFKSSSGDNSTAISENNIHSIFTSGKVQEVE